jgi:surfeit locus 1 family protein
MKLYGRKVLIAVAWALLIFVLVQLGFWQLHRAQALNKATAPTPDQAVVALTDVASAGMNLPIKAVNRIVSATGVYQKTFVAKDQKYDGEKVANLDVRVLRLDNNFSILVVRGIAETPPPSISGKVEVTGRIYPRQNVDRAFAKSGELSRIDPALVVSKEFPFLYDGYLILRSEKVLDGTVTSTKLIPSPQISQRIAGFYWQHISYVVVWWFMALLVLVLPLFPQMRQRSYISIAAEQNKSGKPGKKVKVTKK